MIRTIIKPTTSSFNLTLDFPENYLGKEIEVIAFQKEEGLIMEKPKKSMVDFTGILSENDYQSLKLNSEKAREQWNRDI